MVPDQRRIDLVSEESYVDEMAERDSGHFHALKQILPFQHR